jgi:hypothetical protein
MLLLRLVTAHKREVLQSEVVQQRRVMLILQATSVLVLPLPEPSYQSVTLELTPSTSLQQLLLHLEVD